MIADAQVIAHDALPPTGCSVVPQQDVTKSRCTGVRCRWKVMLLKTTHKEHEGDFTFQKNVHLSWEVAHAQSSATTWCEKEWAHMWEGYGLMPSMICTKGPCLVQCQDMMTKSGHTAKCTYNWAQLGTLLLIEYFNILYVIFFHLRNIITLLKLESTW